MVVDDEPKSPNLCLVISTNGEDLGAEAQQKKKFDGRLASPCPRLTRLVWEALPALSGLPDQVNRVLRWLSLTQTHQSAKAKAASPKRADYDSHALFVTNYS